MLFVDPRTSSAGYFFALLSSFADKLGFEIDASSIGKADQVEQDVGQLLFHSQTQPRLFEFIPGTGATTPLEDLKQFGMPQSKLRWPGSWACGIGPTSR